MAVTRGIKLEGEALKALMDENTQIGESLHLLTIESGLGVEKGFRLEDTRYVTVYEDIAVIDLIGPIYPRANGMQTSGATSAQQFANDFAKAYNNPNVSALIINADSPGGDVRGIGEAAGLVFAARKDGKKPVRAYASGYNASASYHITSAARDITGNNDSLSGSIGTVLSGKRKNENEIEIVSSISPNKRPNPDSTEGYAILQQQVDDMAENFVKAVAKHRGLKREEVIENYGHGNVFVGPRAKQHGLIETIGTLSSVIDDTRRELRRGTRTAAASASVIAIPTAVLAHTEQSDLLEITEEDEMNFQQLKNMFKKSDSATIAGVGTIAAPIAGAAPAAIAGTTEGAPAATGQELDAAGNATAISKLPTRAELMDTYADAALLFSNNMVTDSRILPAEASQAAMALLNAKVDDTLYGGTSPYLNASGELVEGTREEAVRATYENRPKHTLAEKGITAVREGQAAASVLAEGEVEKVKASVVTQERKDQLLATSAQGRAALEARNKS